MTERQGGTVLRGRKILFVLGTLELGGSERQAIILAEHLKRVEGADVRVFGLLGRRGRAARMCDEIGIPAEIIPASWPSGRIGKMAGVKAFATRVRAERPDILLPYGWLPDVLCGLAWRLSGASTCIWNQRNEGIGLDRSRLHRLAVRLTQWFASNSIHGKDFLVERYGVAPDRIRIIPNGIRLAPPADGRAAWRRRLGIADIAVAACMIANIHPNKDHATLLRAWRRLLDRRDAERLPRPVLLLAGRIDESTALKVLAFDLGLGDSVRLVGPVDDVPGLLGAVDLFVYSSRSEGCPNAVLEAMAAAVPVIASDIPGVREAVGPDGLPCLVPPGDETALAGRLADFLRDPGPWSSLRPVLADRVERGFGVGPMCEASARMIGEALAFSGRSTT